MGIIHSQNLTQIQVLPQVQLLRVRKRTGGSKSSNSASTRSNANSSNDSNYSKYSLRNETESSLEKTDTEEPHSTMTTSSSTTAFSSVNASRKGFSSQSYDEVDDKKELNKDNNKVNQQNYRPRRSVVANTGNSDRNLLRQVSKDHSKRTIVDISEEAKPKSSNHKNALTDVEGMSDERVSENYHSMTLSIESELNTEGDIISHKK